MSLRAISILIALCVLSPAAWAASVVVEVRDAQGAALADAVVSAVPLDGKPGVVRGGRAVMDQKDKTFVPHVLAVEVGTSVKFPNSDDIQHSVYSFSPAKPFQLPLYKGTPSEPIVFAEPGVVTLGCNIHDKMNGYIVVLDTPYFEKTESTGRAELRNLPDGKYTINVWQPEMKEAPPAQTVILGESEPTPLKFSVVLLPPALAPATTNKLEDKFKKFANGRQ
jgi:plastocyanin